jgi:hypothetical protein
VVATPVAARELPAHPLLAVRDSQDTLVREVVEHLTAPKQPPGPSHGAAGTAAAGAVRTWDTVAGEYLAEVHAAMAGLSPAGELTRTNRQP